MLQQDLRLAARKFSGKFSSLEVGIHVMVFTVCLYRGLEVYINDSSSRFYYSSSYGKVETALFFEWGNKT